MLDRDFANRFLAFYILGVEKYGSKEFGQDLDSFMSKAMGTIYDKTEDELVDIANQFSASMTLAYDIFGKDAIALKNGEVAFAIKDGKIVIFEHK